MSASFFGGRLFATTVSDWWELVRCLTKNLQSPKVETVRASVATEPRTIELSNWVQGKGGSHEDLLRQWRAACSRNFDLLDIEGILAAAVGVPEWPEVESQLGREVPVKTHAELHHVGPK